MFATLCCECTNQNVQVDAIYFLFHAQFHFTLNDKIVGHKNAI